MMKKSFKPVNSYSKNHQKFSTILQLPVHDHADLYLAPSGTSRAEVSQNRTFQLNRAQKETQAAVEKYAETFQERQWLRSMDPASAMASESEESTFRVMSYNMLAPSLVYHKNLDLYPHVSKKNLNWERRSAKIIKELELARPDILCLQEFDSNEQFVSNYLQESGYRGAFKGKHGSKIDGCGIYWNPKKFEQILTTSLEYRVKQETTLLHKEQNALYVALRPKEGDLNQVCLVANTHLLYNCFRGDIKTMQLKLVLEGLEELKKHFESQGDKVSVIFCGDLNLTPSSALYHFISEGELNVQGIKRNKMSGQYLACKRDPSPEDQDRLFDSQQYHLVKKFATNKYSQLSESRPENWFPEVIGSKVHFDAEEEKLSISLDSEIEYNPEFQEEYQMMNEVPKTSEVDTVFMKSMYGCEQDGRLKMRTHPGKAGENYTMTHDLGLVSSYASARKSDDPLIPDTITGEPHVTHSTANALLTTDYIWFTDDNLKVKRVLDIPSLDQHLYDLGCPNDLFPSDHFSLVTEFTLK